MTRDEIRVIRHTFQLIEGKEEAFTLYFYNRLFQIDGSLRNMFRHDITAQAKKLADVLKILNRALDRLDSLRPTFRELGSHHVRYGVVPSHYQTVGKALLLSLEEVAGPRFDAAMKQAWTKLLQLISGEMLRGAETQELATA